MPDVFLVATDTTEAAVPAIRVAVQLARAAGAAVLAVHVVETPGELARWSAPIFKKDLKAYKKLLDKQIQVAEARIRQQIAALTDKAVDVDVEVVVKSGSVADTVLEVARSREVALIILGKGRQPATLAAMAERIARLARRPVLIVPSKWTRRLRTRLAVPLPMRRPTARARVLRAAS